MSSVKRILVAMSGGVDSSTAAAILKQEGHEVIGVGMKFPVLPSEVVTEGACCGIAGMADARRVALKIGIPFYVLDFEDLFERTIIEPFCQEYLRGRTPNPCVECNRVLKFDRLLLTGRAIGTECVASGHYARTEYDSRSGRYLLKKGRDTARDQSYFLYALSQSQLAAVLFPLGDKTKEETRAIARALGLDVWDKPGSQDICFLGSQDYRSFLRQRVPQALRPGEIVDADGRVLGHHDGVADFTIGQRRGIGVAMGTPLYVLAVDPATARVVVGTREETLTRRVLVGQVNWIAFDVPPSNLRADVRVRYRQPEIPADLSCRPDGSVEVLFSETQPRPAPGQSAVFYDGETVLGGGIIEDGGDVSRGARESVASP